MESRPLALILAGMLVACAEREPGAGAGAAQPPQVPDGMRIRVEVINTTAQRGLARRATFFLRDQGFDVVRFTSGAPPRDSTQVIDRSGNPEGARLVARALGVARFSSARDSARYLDVSVLLGRDWRPPAKPFYP
ncbi:MAG: LytR C-terminal domain-containing protein [Gemmatimonadaceae bacterium]